MKYGCLFSPRSGLSGCIWALLAVALALLVAALALAASVLAKHEKKGRREYDDD